MTITCKSCGAELEREQAIVQAGPSGADWFCLDGVGCRRRARERWSK